MHSEQTVGTTQFHAHGLLIECFILPDISCLRIDHRGKEHAAKMFRSDPSIQVLLLHGSVCFSCVLSVWILSYTIRLYRDRENAGLNITCASRVFLVESVVHHGFEIQGRYSYNCLHRPLEARA